MSCALFPFPFPPPTPFLYVKINNVQTEEEKKRNNAKLTYWKILLSFNEFNRRRWVVFFFQSENRLLIRFQKFYLKRMKIRMEKMDAK